MKLALICLKRLTNETLDERTGSAGLTASLLIPGATYWHRTHPRLVERPIPVERTLTVPMPGPTVTETVTEYVPLFSPPLPSVQPAEAAHPPSQPSYPHATSPSTTATFPPFAGPSRSGESYAERQAREDQERRLDELERQQHREKECRDSGYQSTYWCD